MHGPSGMKVKPAPMRLTTSPEWAAQWREKNQRKAEAHEGARGSQVALQAAPQASILAVASLPRRYAQVRDLAPDASPLETPSLAQRHAHQDAKHDPTSVHKDLLAQATAQEAVAQNPGAALPFVPPDSFRNGFSGEVEKWLRRLGEPRPAQRAAYSGTRDMSQARTAPASGAGPAASIQPSTAPKSSD
jgi:hypothetical protein